MQFGVDATRAGVVETPAAESVAAVLSRLHRPTETTVLIGHLEQVGLDAGSARSLLDDLLAYGVLHEAIPCADSAVTLIGRSALAGSITQLLHKAGVTVRAPLYGESETAYLKLADPSRIVLVIDRLAQARSLSPVLAKRAATWIPAAVIDSRALVGPLRIDSHGPCLMCMNLHRADLDRHWSRMLAQQAARPTAPDPASVAATAAVVTAIALQLLGVPDPPGSQRAAHAAGDVVEVDAYGVGARRTLAPHRHCPVCFYIKPLSTPSIPAP